jgi:hypothetical protein
MREGETGQREVRKERREDEKLERKRLGKERLEGKVRDETKKEKAEKREWGKREHGVWVRKKRPNREFDKDGYGERRERIQYYSGLGFGSAPLNI